MNHFSLACLLLNKFARSKLFGSTCNLLACCPRASSSRTVLVACQNCLGLPATRQNPANLLHSLPILFTQPAYHEVAPFMIQRGRSGGGSSSSSSNNSKNDNNNNHSNNNITPIKLWSGLYTKNFGVDFTPGLISIVLCLHQVLEQG